MSQDGSFVDYYDILQVNPHCDPKMLEAAFHHFAKLYHPDHAHPSETDKFHDVNEAYRVLRDPEQRAAFDEVYGEHFGVDLSKNGTGKDAGPHDAAALEDADDHARILMFLYKKRRENAQDAGVVGFHLQNLLRCSDEHFEFHKWYLKEKGFIVLTEQGTLAITIEGVDHVISMSKTEKAEKLLLARMDGTGERVSD